MGTLSTLKAAATADLATAKTSIVNYVSELESAAKTSKSVMIGVALVGLMVGAVIGHLA
jgi:hypothetical protein